MPVDHEYPTPNPHINTFISGPMTFFVRPSFKAIGIVDEVVLPFPFNEITYHLLSLVFFEAFLT